MTTIGCLMENITANKADTKYYQKQEEQAAWLMTLPAVLGLIIFVGLPFCIAVILSLTRYKIDSPLPMIFVGFEQYARILTDESFKQAFINNSIFAFFVVPLQTISALVLALICNRPLRSMIFFRSIFFLPVIFPMTLVAIVWKLILGPGPLGLLNSFMNAVTFSQWQPVDFLNHPDFALPSIILLSMWQGVGFQMIILLAALQNIPISLYEAARLDGATPWKQFIHVTLPGLRNAIIFVSLITTILAFRLFDQIWILTQGGPQNHTTTVMYETVRVVFQRQDVARGAAMSVVFFIVVLTITLFQRWLIRQEKQIE